MRFAILVTFCSLNFAAIAAAPALSFVSPRGGELYVVGQKQTVLLNSKLKSVTIELSRDGGVTFETLGTIDNLVKDKTKRNNLAFTVSGAASTNCVIRARGTANTGELSLVSNAFSISTPGTFTGAAEIADGSVTTPKLADAAVTTPKMNSGAASSGMLLTADGLGGASFTTLAPATTVASTSGNSIVAAINDASTTNATLNADVLTGTATINVVGNVSATDGSGTDGAGTALTLSGGRSTGTGSGGSVVIATSPAATFSGNTTNNLVNRVTITGAGITALYKGATVASPGGTITPTGNVFDIVGMGAILGINSTGVPNGTIITMYFNGPGVTVFDAFPLMLNGNFSSTADGTLTLLFTGTKWIEISRSNN